jgi:hypothetical protein
MPVPSGGLTKDELLTHYGTSRHELEPGAQFWVISKQEAASDGSEISKEGWLRILESNGWGQYYRDIAPPEVAWAIEQRNEYVVRAHRAEGKLNRIPRWIRWLFKAL